MCQSHDYNTTDTGDRLSRATVPVHWTWTTHKRCAENHYNLSWNTKHQINQLTNCHTKKTSKWHLHVYRAIILFHICPERLDIGNVYRIALHCIALHYFAFNLFHCVYWYYIASHCIPLHCIKLHCAALHWIALHCISSYRISFKSSIVSPSQWRSSSQRWRIGRPGHSCVGQDQC